MLSARHDEPQAVCRSVCSSVLVAQLIKEKRAKSSLAWKCAGCCYSWSTLAKSTAAVVVLSTVWLSVCLVVVFPCRFPIAPRGRGGRRIGYSACVGLLLGASQQPAVFTAYVIAAICYRLTVIVIRVQSCTVTEWSSCWH